MGYNPNNYDGQTTAARSAPVVLASDQPPLEVLLPDDVSPAAQNITAQDIGSSTATGANSQSIITGAPTASSAASFTFDSEDSVRVMVTGTWTGTVQIEVSLDGGTTWAVAGAHQTGTAYVTATFAANFAGVVNVAGCTNFRVRATAAWTGTATVTVVESTNPSSLYIINPVRMADSTTPSQQLAISAGGAAKVDGSAVTQPISASSLPLPALAATSTKQSDGTQKAQITDGTNSAGVFVSGTPNSAANAVPVAGSTESHSFSVASVSAGTTYDVGNHAWVSVQILTQYVGTTPTITFQSSDDGTNWNTIALQASNSILAQGSVNTTGTALFHGPLPGRYFRLNFTGAYSSGTATGTVTFLTVPRAIVSMGVSAVQNGTWTVTSNASSEYPTGATPITAASGNVANGSAVATLAAVSAKTTYITGFEITSSGATAGSVVSPTVTGTVTGTLTYTYAAPAGVLAMGTPLIVEFAKPIPASAVNTPIAVTLPALGLGNTNATVVAHGYQL